MLLEMGAMIGAYLGLRIYESYVHNEPKKKVIQSQSAVTQQCSPSKKTSPLTKSVKKDNVPQTIKINHDRYLAISIINLGISIIKPFMYQPVIVPIYLGLFIHNMLPIFRSAEKQIRENKVGLEVLITSSSLLGMALSQYSGMQIDGVFYYLGHKLVAKAEGQSKKIFTDIFAQLPRKVWVVRSGVEIEVALEQVAADDIVVVSMGETIAIDGLIVNGMAMVDQHALTGEAQPIEKQTGDNVLASTVVISGKIWIKVEQTGQATIVSQVSQILNQAAQFKTQTHLRGDEWSHKAVMPFMGLSTVAYLLTGPMGALVCLSSHFGTRLKMIAPLGTLNYLEIALKKGILVKDGRALEKLSQIDSILFDKTGTLTQEMPAIVQIVACNDYNENKILHYAAIAEQKLRHPIAKAIVNQAQKDALHLPDIADSQYHIGYGVTVTYQAQTIQVGSQRFLETEGMTIPDTIQAAMQQAHEQGHSLVMVAVDQQVIGAIEMQAVVRAEVRQLIQQLRQRGVKYMAIVSGDQKQPTQKLAKTLGMDDYFYEVLPQEKAQIVEKLQSERKQVCFVGDGINDTIAMEKADVSISLTGASSIATDVAQIILMEANLAHIDELFMLSRKLDANLKNGFSLLLIPSAIGLAGVFWFKLSFVSLIMIKNFFFLGSLTNAMQPLISYSHRKSK